MLKTSNPKSTSDASASASISETIVDAEIIQLLESKPKDTLEIVQNLFQENKHKDVEGRTLLHFAARLGHHTSTKWLLQQSFFDINEVDKSGQSPLHVAVKHARTAMVSLLLRHGAIQFQDNDGDFWLWFH